MGKGSAWAAMTTVSLGLFASCGDDTSGQTSDGLRAKDATLTGNAVARAGTQEVTGELVAAVARAQKIDVERAARLAVRDALFAEAALRADVDQRPEVSAAMKAELAKAMLIELGRAARDQGPVTDQELETLTERHWLSVDRPEGFRVSHAVVIADEKQTGNVDEATWDRAKKAAQAMRDSLDTAPEIAKSSSAPEPQPDGRLPPDAADVAFAEEVKTVDLTLKAQVQRLSPICADGYALTPSRTTYVPEFVENVVSLTERGEVVGPFRSAYGWHVVMLLERVPESRKSASERRELFLEEAIATRAHEARRAIVDAKQPAVELTHEADGLLALLNVRGSM